MTEKKISTMTSKFVMTLTLKFKTTIVHRNVVSKLSTSQKYVQMIRIADDE